METLKIKTVLSTLKSTENQVEMHTYKWGVQNPKGVVIISHGMAEEASRYNDFACALNSKGLSVYAADHVAHGLTAPEIKLIGQIPGHNFLQVINEGVKAVTDYAKAENPNIPFYIFSHSMGSMATQDYIQTYPNDFEKVVFCGTDMGSVKYKAAALLAKSIMKKNGELFYSDFVHNLGVGAFDKAFKGEPPLSWLSVNKENIEKYKANPYCGAMFPVNYYYSVASTLCKTVKKENIKLVKAKKILFICGEDDPVTNFSKSPNKLNQLYNKLGLKSEFICFKNARHEILNEDPETKNKVYETVSNFYLN